MNRLAILSNAGSGRNRSRSELLRLLDATSGVDHRVTATAEEVPEVLAMLLAREPSVLAVNGGDGTVQAVLTAWADLMLADAVPATAPAIAILPAGSTNMTAHDVGCGGRMRRRVGDLLALRDRDRGAWSTEARQPLAIVDGDHVRRLGFFFGMGTIVRGMEYWHERLHHGGGAGEWGAGAALARAAWGLFRRQPPFHEAARVQMTLDGRMEPPEQHEISFLLATSMRRLILGLSPFWGQGAGALSVTWVDDGARRLMPRLPALLTGRGHRLPERDGYHGRRSDALGLSFAEPWAVDGEIFPMAGSLSITPGPAFEFVNLADDLALAQGS